MHTIKGKLKLLLLLGAYSLFMLSGCDKKSGVDAAAKNKPEKVSTISDKPLAAFQNELLDIAFETATSIPVKPHTKDRSKTQEEVVAVCLKLDQPNRALGYIEKIDNWRRGWCYADLAFYRARHGDVNEIQHYLDLANKIAEDNDIGEDWRRDRIKVRIVQTHALLGQTQKADEFEKGVVDSESGKVAGARAMAGDKDSFDEQMKILDKVVAAGVFDVIKNELESAKELFNRFYEDTEKRTLVENKIKSSWFALPVLFRIELLTTMAGFAADHNDKGKALELINEAQLLLDNHVWDPENQIATTAQLVKLRCRADDLEKAAACADAALALFNDKRDSIINIHRAGVLRPLAEGYQSMGDKDKALSVCKQAVEEGIVNINSRPRAEDLSATCCSMALYAVEPDAGLWTRIHQIREALGDPW